MIIKSGQTMAEFFGFRDNPFADTYRLTDPYLSESEERLLLLGHSLIATGKGFALTGASGIGKSTLMKHLMTTLDKKQYHPVTIHYGGLVRSGVLRAIADRLGVDTCGRSIPLLVRIQKRIADMGSGQHPQFPVFIVDDAHLMEKESLMDMCSLTFNQSRETIAACVVLIGDETLAKMLELHVMASVTTRLTGHYTMKALGHHESREFILSRISQAKASKDLFERDALDLIAANCRGNRRQIMNMGTLLLLEAFMRQEKTISAELIIGCDQITISE